MTDAPRHTNAVVWTIAFTNFAGPFMFAGVGVTLPSMGRELVMSGGTLGLFETLYLGTAAALMLPIGRLGDAGDKNSLFTAGVMVFTVATAVLGLLHSVPAFLAVRVLQGTAAAVVSATNMAILTETVPRERLGRAIGVNIGAVYAGLSAGPFVAGLITTHLGWRWVYGVSAVLLALACAALWRNLPRTWRRPRMVFDWPGTLTSAAGLLLLVLGSALVERTAAGWYVAGAGLALLVVFVMVERRAPSPLLPLQALTGNKVLLRALTVQLLTYAGAFGTAFLFSIYLQEAKGWTAAEAGRLLMVSPVLMALLAPPCGRLADRVRPQLLSALGVAAILLGTAAAWPVPATGSLALLVLSLVGHGVGFALFSSPNMKVIMNTAPRERTAMASALAAQMRTLGMVFSMMAITVFLAVHVGGSGLGEHTLGGLLTAMRWSFGTITVVAVWALATALRDVRGQSKVSVQE